ncbi:MAG: ribose 5-phosphate isomerase B [Desulfobulbaceae bacterium]|nr:MAG: ribose 5-phosphate isomerase B [Desulfobulbaceae bacterium]
MQKLSNDTDYVIQPKPGQTMNTISLGSDHAGYILKEKIKIFLENKGYKINDFGCFSEEASDYPDYCYPAALSVATGESDFGIVFGGSGNGEAMVANKVRGVRCGVCWNIESARLTKQHNNANMIAIGARMVSESEALEMVHTWLNEKFEGGRHLNRLSKMEKRHEPIL